MFARYNSQRTSKVGNNSFPFWHYLFAVVVVSHMGDV